MLTDKVYLWLVIISCVALATASTFAIIELMELQEPVPAAGALF